MLICIVLLLLCKTLYSKAEQPSPSIGDPLNELYSFPSQGQVKNKPSKVMLSSHPPSGQAKSKALKEEPLFIIRTLLPFKFVMAVPEGTCKPINSGFDIFTVALSRILEKQSFTTVSLLQFVKRIRENKKINFFIFRIGYGNLTLQIYKYFVHLLLVSFLSV